MMHLKRRLLFAGPIAVFVWLTASAALAQARRESVTIHYTLISPIIALLAGILILIMPRLLNYIVALYLIIMGLLGLFGPLRL